ncbi:MAG: serine hydrolase [Flavobacteriales bacterium]|nr:serine hydrolase [Flavobacteriales bacterium]
MRLRRRVPLYAVAVSWVVGVAGTVLWMGPARSHPRVAVKEQVPAPKVDCGHSVQRLAGFGHVRPMLSVEATCEAVRFADLRTELSAHLLAAQSTSRVKRASIYVRDLESDEWLAINGLERFDPGSLMKVPTMLTMLMMAEQDPALFAHRFRMDLLMEFPNQQFPPTQELEDGKEYTLGELLQASIGRSSNRAEALMLRHAGAENYRKLLLTIGLPDFVAAARTYPITAPEYAQFFKALYNASVLSPRNADLALGLLVHSDFDKGLRKGIPAGIEVASKFGETGNEGDRQLHEAAIVYAQGHPYLIVVMTNGRTAEPLAEFLGTTAGIVHAFMTGKRPA